MDCFKSKHYYYQNPNDEIVGKHPLTGISNPNTCQARIIATDIYCFRLYTAISLSRPHPGSLPNGAALLHVAAQPVGAKVLAEIQGERIRKRTRILLTMSSFLQADAAFQAIKKDGQDQAKLGPKYCANQCVMHNQRVQYYVTYSNIT